MKNEWMQLGWFELWSKNRDVILIRAKDYFENDKERLRRQARDKYRNLFEEEKNKKREYGKNRNYISEETIFGSNKQKLCAETLKTLINELNRLGSA